jgi:ribosomal protein L25 (general stress protein Ctc)
MEKKLTLKAQVRTADEKAKYLRQERVIPGVVYGKHQDAINLKVDYSDFLKLFRVA